MQTRVFKDRDGWKAETRLDLEGSRVLMIKTRRNLQHKLASTASVWHCDGGGVMRHAYGFGTGGDYDQPLIQVSVPRVTESVVQAQHKRAIADLPYIKSRVAEHYALVLKTDAMPGQATSPAGDAVTTDANPDDCHVPD